MPAACRSARGCRQCGSCCARPLEICRSATNGGSGRRWCRHRLRPSWRDCRRLVQWPGQTRRHSRRRACTRRQTKVISVRRPCPHRSRCRQDHAACGVAPSPRSVCARACIHICRSARPRTRRGLFPRGRNTARNDLPRRNECAGSCHRRLSWRGRLQWPAGGRSWWSCISIPELYLWHVSGISRETRASMPLRCEIPANVDCMRV